MAKPNVTASVPPSAPAFARDFLMARAEYLEAAADFDKLNEMDVSVETVRAVCAAHDATNRVMERAAYRFALSCATEVADA